MSTGQRGNIDGSDASGAQPNILLVTVDQWPGQLLGCAGHPDIETPTLDRLASLGTRYTRCYSETPICIPARRALMTGTSARRHGDRDFKPDMPMPQDLPTLARLFRDEGYQTWAIGKLHVYPPRDRIGFDDVLMVEEGRSHLGGPDDYEIFLADQGYPGQQFMHGMSNNEYGWRTWHLPEHAHVTNWISWAAARQIKRRDPTRPALWLVSYTHPHPPLVPLASYYDRYRDRSVTSPVNAEWASDPGKLPYVLRSVRGYWDQLSARQLADMRRAFYALCTHIDHQLRILIGTLREEGLLDNTVICFTSDHGDMLGDNGLYAKRLMYEGSANVPLIIVDRKNSVWQRAGSIDNRLVGLQDITPTLLDLAGVAIPETCEGVSAIARRRRDFLYGETYSDARASRMIHNGRYKLIWYPAGNHIQLFDLEEDPAELHDLSGRTENRAITKELTALLISCLYGEDEAWIKDDQLVGMVPPNSVAIDNRDLSGQRGIHFPPVPAISPTEVVGSW